MWAIWKLISFTSCPSFQNNLYSQQLSYGKSQDAPLLMNGLRKMWYLNTMEFYSAVKNEIL
jgi:hypothetical protein